MSAEAIIQTLRIFFDRPLRLLSRNFYSVSISGRKIILWLSLLDHDRIVAIKVLPSDLSTNRHLRKRFEREARAVYSVAAYLLLVIFVSWTASVFSAPCESRPAVS
jgi:hypothetical protein